MTWSSTVWIMPDLPAAEKAAADFLVALDIPVDGEEMFGTPGRMARAYAEMLSPRPST
jgi:GTP cyclohydrolase I